MVVQLLEKSQKFRRSKLKLLQSFVVKYNIESLAVDDLAG